MSSLHGVIAVIAAENNAKAMIRLRRKRGGTKGRPVSCDRVACVRLSACSLSVIVRARRKASCA